MKHLCIVSIVFFVFATFANAQSSEIELRITALVNPATEIETRERLIQEFSSDLLLPAVLDRIELVKLGANSTRELNALWRLLALVPNAQGDADIVSADRVAEMVSGYTTGAKATKLIIAERLPNVTITLQDDLVEQINNELVLETDPVLLITRLKALAKTGRLDPVNFNYVNSIAHDLSQLHTPLRDQLNLDPIMLEVKNSTESQIAMFAFMARCAAFNSLAEMTTYMEAAPDILVVVSDAMALIDLSNIFANATNQDRMDWIQEYGRRYCLDASALHRSRFSIRYFLRLTQMMPNQIDDLCAILSSVESSCPTQSATLVSQLKSSVCP